MVRFAVCICHFFLIQNLLNVGNSCLILVLWETVSEFVPFNIIWLYLWGYTWTFGCIISFSVSLVDLFVSPTPVSSHTHSTHQQGGKASLWLQEVQLPLWKWMGLPRQLLLQLLVLLMHLRRLLELSFLPIRLQHLSSGTLLVWMWRQVLLVFPNPVLRFQMKLGFRYVLQML